MNQIDSYHAGMNEIDIRQLDLNLLVTLEALLRWRSVTRAAQELRKTQSAVSHALARLRGAFDDRLLVPGRGEMALTPRAEGLREPLGQALQQIRGLWRDPGTFDPGTTRRGFSLACVDALGALAPGLLRWFRHEAPEARLELSPRAVSDRALALESGQIDLLLDLPLGGGEGFRQEAVGELSWMSFVRADHPLLQGPLTLDRWASWPCVMVSTGSSSPSMIDEALRVYGLERPVRATVPGFLLAPHVVAHSDLIVTAPHVLAPLAVGLMGLRALRPPLTLPTPEVVLTWHVRWQDDPAHRWFREGVAREVRALW
jgi:DNA-binding transcriptional LysR family regulator